MWPTYKNRGARWCICLRHGFTSRKVANSFPYGVIWIFHWLKASGRAMVLWSTHSLTEINNRDMSGDKRARCIELITLPISCANCLEILGAATSWNP